MKWYVIDRNEPDMLETLDMMGVPALTVPITKPRAITGICFPEGDLTQVLLALGLDPEETKVEEYLTDKENYVFIIPRGATTVDTMVPQFRTLLEKYARNHQTHVSYLIGDVPAEVPPGLFITEKPAEKVGPPTHLFGRTWLMELASPHPLRMILRDQSGTAYAEVVPGAVIILARISQLKDPAQASHLLSLILDQTIPRAFDPTLPDVIERLRREEEEREIERQRAAQEEQRRREEAEHIRAEEEERRLRKEQEEQRLRAEEEARQAKIELEARRAQMGPDVRKRWVAICLKRRRSTIAKMANATEAAFENIRKAAADVVMVGWERETLRAKRHALMTARELCFRATRETLMQLVKHPLITHVGFNEVTGELVVTTSSLPTGSSDAKKWSIRMGDLIPRVILAPESGGDKNADNILNDEDIYPAFLKFVASRDYVSATNLIINHLVEGGSHA